MTATSLAAPARTTYLAPSKIFAVGLGNALSFYDFLTFSFFALQIGHTFFPAGDRNSLLYSLAAFGVGFVTRPLGGLIIGAYADRVGRKPAMILSFALMGGGVVGLALTPSYAAIGYAAPALLVFFRLIQGFALGGEVGPSTAFLVEAAPPHRRGLYIALQYATQDFAGLAAGVVGLIIASSVTASQLDAWGWRLAFLLGAVIVPVGLMMRRSLPETLFTTPAPERSAGEGRRPRAPVRILILGLGILGAGTIATYVMNYMTTYVQDSLHLAAVVGFSATIVGGVANVVSDIICGVMSDRMGRKRIMLTAGVLFALTAPPAFMLMIRFPTLWVVLAVTAALSVLLSFMSAPGLITITESLPKSVRSGALGVLYAVAIAGFGGTTQFVVKWLTVQTGSPMAPAWYMTAAMVIGILAMAMVRETAPVRTGVTDDLL